MPTSLFLLDPLPPPPPRTLDSFEVLNDPVKNPVRGPAALIGLGEIGIVVVVDVLAVTIKGWKVGVTGEVAEFCCCCCCFWVEVDVKLDRSDLGLIAEANDRPVDTVVAVVVVAIVFTAVVIVAGWLVAETDFGEDELGEEDPDDAADELIV